jgi:UDP-glucose:(heptosyl)LPS alpha-1,3-glucosyltransferase
MKYGFDLRATAARLRDKNRAMKIGLVRRGYSPSGGAERYLRRFAAELVRASHTCALFSSEPWPDWQHDFFLVKGNTPRAFADALSAARPREKCDRLFSLERVWECDCYRAGDGVHRVALAQRARFEPGLRTWIRKFDRTHRELLEIEAHLFSRSGAGTVIANSKMVRREIVQEYGFAEEKIAVIYNGLPAEKLQPQLPDRLAARRQFALRDDEMVALFVGSGWERKGLRFAMQAVEKLRHATLLVAGRGKTRGLPRAPRSRFLGEVEQLAALYAAADVFVLPTIYEPFSNACLEAAAAGLPIVTTVFNGFAELFTPGLVLSDPRDITTLSAAIGSCGERREINVERCREAIRGYSIERNVAETLAWLEP